MPSPPVHGREKKGMGGHVLPRPVPTGVGGFVARRDGEPLGVGHGAREKTALAAGSTRPS